MLNNFQNAKILQYSITFLCIRTRNKLKIYSAVVLSKYHGGFKEFSRSFSETSLSNWSRILEII